MITANNHKKPALHCHSQDNFRRNYSIMKAILMGLKRETAEPNMEKRGGKKTTHAFHKEHLVNMKKRSKLFSAHS